MEVKSMGGVGEWDRVSEFGPRIDPGEGTQAFQEQGKLQAVRKKGHRKGCFVPCPLPFPLQTLQLIN